MQAMAEIALTAAPETLAGESAFERLVSTQLNRCKRVPWTAAMGHEERFPPTRLSGRYRSESSLLQSSIANRDF
jgi:hypothetical protein